MKNKPNWNIITNSPIPVTEERRAEILMNVQRKLKAVKKNAELQKYPQEEISELGLMIKSLDEELLKLVPKIPEYKL